MRCINCLFRKRANQICCIHAQGLAGNSLSCPLLCDCDSARSVVHYSANKASPSPSHFFMARSSAACWCSDSLASRNMQNHTKKAATMATATAIATMAISRVWSSLPAWVDVPVLTCTHKRQLCCIVCWQSSPAVHHFLHPSLQAWSTISCSMETELQALPA